MKVMKMKWKRQATILKKSLLKRKNGGLVCLLND